MTRSNESLVWKLEVRGIKLFTKLSATEAQCNVCVDPATNEPKKYKLSNRSPTVLIPHITKHSEYKKKWDKMQTQEEKKMENRKSSLNSFLVKGTVCICNVYSIYFQELQQTTVK
jgi:hypothetical protein